MIWNISLTQLSQLKNSAKTFKKNHFQLLKNRSWQKNAPNVWYNINANSQKSDKKGAYHYDKPKQPIWTDKYCIFKGF